MEAIIEKQKIEKIDFSKEEFAEHYENCLFVGCNFSNLLIGNVKFENCRFELCNLSLTKMNNTAWRDAFFVECKMTGINFSNSNPFSTFHFEKSNLQYASFVEMKLQNTQ
ncbi:MAG: pentapeptide repeat-containing protein, partial [Bacteroidales bacterium]